MRPSIKGSNILVTGGAGFIGSHLVEAILKLNPKKIIILDNMFLGSEKNLLNVLGDKVILIKDDVEHYFTLKNIITINDIEIVFNLATKALNHSFEYPYDAFKVNIKSTLNLLELQRMGIFKTLVHFSTSEVYGSAVYEPIDEKHPFIPTTTYAAGKAAADLAIQSWVNMFNLDAIIMRPFNNYGERQNHQEPLSGLIPRTIKHILLSKPPEIQGNGLQTRDFIYVEDTVSCVLKLYPILDAGESVNICSDGQISVKEIIDRIVYKLGYKGKIVNSPARKADVYTHNASNAKLKSLINHQFTDFESGLNKTINYYRILLLNSDRSGKIYD